MNKRSPLYQSLLLKCISFLVLQFLSVNGYSQNREKEPKPELAMGINVITGEIIYGSNNFYITDPTSATLGPMFRYDYPIKLSTKRNGGQYICGTAQAGFLFGKAKIFDSLYFHAKNPSYLHVSIGLYSRSTLSVGTGLFFWKGLGTRDIWGIKFLSVGYNAYNFRVNASVQHYSQVMKNRNGGTLFSFDFLWKLIKEN